MTACRLILAVDMNKLLDGSQCIYRLQMADRMISCEEVSREQDVVGSCAHDGTPSATYINKQVDRLTVFFMNDIDTIGGYSENQWR